MSFSSSQSPVNIPKYEAIELEDHLHFCYHGNFVHANHAPQGYLFNWDESRMEKSYLQIHDETYYPLQFHFHVPSEHVIENTQYPMELHLVHVNRERTGCVVLAILFEYGDEENPFLSQFWKHVPNLTPDPTQKTMCGKVRLSHLQILHNKFYRYTGSLTTPPYTEGVEWIVMEYTEKATKAQIDEYRNLVKNDNNRQIQELGCRKVFRSGFFKPKCAFKEESMAHIDVSVLK